MISVSVGWGPEEKGYDRIVAAVDRAKKEGIFVVSSSLSETYGGKPTFHGLGREPPADPDKPSSYRPGMFWADTFFARRDPSANYAVDWAPNGLLLVPMDSRCFASPTGANDYLFYREGGWSWSIPYIAGLYALACQVKPDVTPESFWNAAMATGDSVKIKHAGREYTLERIVNPRKLIEKLRE